MRWPNLLKLAVAYFNAELDVRVVTKLPAELEKALPVVRVTRGPGGDDGVTDAPLLDVEVFTALGGAVDPWDLAEDAREAAHRLAGRVVDGALVDTVSTSVGPTSVEYSPNTERVVASYRLGLRKRPTP